MVSTALYRHNGDIPAALPFDAFDPQGDHWTDLANSPEGRAACGYVEGPAVPDFDPTTHAVRWDAAAEAWKVDVLPPPPPAPEPIPAVLTKLQFIGLAQAAGGMTDAMLVEARNAPAFEAFWLKFQMAENVAKADPITAASLGALSAAGYLPNGAAAVLAAWPAT